ncbi:MAG: hypothetical protein IT328_08960 [Caldilineaceae bacterium]|nr:hypothetical protein [Caldilineaceae bacterium]
MASSSLSPSRRAGIRPQQGWNHGAVLLGYLLLTLLMTWPLAVEFTRAIPGDAFDGWQNYWNLWWVKVALIERVQNPYVTDLLYYPTGVTLYFHTLNPFNGLVTLPIQLTAGLIPAYNMVVLVSWVLSGYGMYLLARWAIGRGERDSGATWRAELAAFVAGAIFAFAPVHMAHLLGHMQVMALQWLPFYVLALLRGMAQVRAGKRWVRAGLLAGLFLTLAGLCDWYFVLYLFLFTGVVIGWAWLSLWLGREWRWRQWLGMVGPAALAGLLFALLLAPILIPMVYEATQYSFMVRPATDLYTFSATLMDFLLPNRLHTLFRPESFAEWGNQVAPVSERTIAVGYGALGLALIALVTLRRRAALWAVAALLFVLLAMGPRLHWLTIRWEDIPVGVTSVQEWSPYALVNRLVPFMRISRSVSRFAIVVQLCVSVLAGMGLAWWLRRLRAQAALVVASVAVLALVLAESWVAPYPMSPPDTPGYYATLAQQPERGAVLNLPMNYDRPGYLLYQTVHQRPLTVAYISREDPRTLTERVPLLQHWRHLGADILAVDPVQVGMTVLSDLGVHIVVLDRYKMPGGDERSYTEGLAGALFADTPATFADDRLTVYAVTPPADPQPYLELGPLYWGPLVVDEDSRYRTVGDGPADLLLRHAARGVQVMIEYWSEADAVVTSVDGSSWHLAAAPEGATLSVALPPGVDRLTFRAPAGQVRVTQLGLALPAE